MARPQGNRAGIGLASQLAALVVGVALGGMGLLVWQRSAPVASTDAEAAVPEGEGQLVNVAKRLLETPKPSKLIYLNREGAVLRGGPDDAAFNTSSVVAGSPGQRAAIPPFAGSPARWNALAKCIREKFSDFDVRVVEQRPVSQDYVMVMVGGTPHDLGFKDDKEHKHAHSHAVGLAPFNGQTIPHAVVFVFTRALRENTKASCEAAAMEIAHAYGLDHARNCKDLMTYMKPCGTRVFVDKAVNCGEHEDRPCEGGAPTQNSYRRLLELLGPGAPAAAATAASKL